MRTRVQSADVRGVAQAANKGKRTLGVGSGTSMYNHTEAKWDTLYRHPKNVTPSTFRTLPLMDSQGLDQPIPGHRKAIGRCRDGFTVKTLQVCARDPCGQQFASDFDN